MVRKHTLNLFRKVANLVGPPPKLTVSEWADEKRVLSKESSAEHGRWNTDRAPYQRDIMNAINDPNIEDIIVMSSAQVGKALDIDTPLPTPNGWKLMRDVQEGDLVFNENGQECKVTFATEVMHNRECFEVGFSDGTSIVADADHLWTVDVHKYGRFIEKRTLMTKEMLKGYKIDRRHNYAIPLCGPLKIEKKTFSIDPYVLGVWLGDGHSYSAQITMHKNDKEIAEYIRQAGYRISIKSDKNILTVSIDPKEKNRPFCIRGHNKDTLGRTKQGYCAECHRQHSLKAKWKDVKKLDPILSEHLSMHNKLESINVLKNKHIPQLYLRGSFQQRLSLLQGLMDTDGHVSERGRCEFSSASLKITNDVSELLASLGIKHTVKKKKTKITRTGYEGVAWRISFLVYDDIPVFRLKRKLTKLKSRDNCRTTETERRRITSIKSVESRSVKCITVDSRSHLYLAGKQMVPTHNTEIINNIIGYFIDYDPAPLLLVMPTLEMAESYSKDRLAAMIRDTPALNMKVSDAKARDGNNTLLHKKFAGGHISLVGANSPASLASRPIRIVLADEVDRFPTSAGTEGDPLSLAHKRTKTFWNRKKVSVSTPTIKGISRIEAEYEESTKEQWCVSCPDCGFFQPYEWTQIRFEPVGMECRSCGEHHGEIQWKSRPAKWIARVPDAPKRGFHINALASPWESWDKIIFEFKEAKRKGTETLKTWKNTTLGEPWEENTSEQDHTKLVARRKIYGCDIPDDVLVLTAGVDVQNDRLEVEVVGWGVDEISWGISYKIFYGDPGQEVIWNQLDAFLQTEWLCNDGSKLSLSATCVDSGGHYTSEVYDFCKDREHRRVFAIKGKGGVGVPYVGRPTKVGRQNVHLFSLGVNEGKDLIYSRLRNEFEDKPGYCHFPIEQEKGYDEAFFVGLTSEYKKIRWINGVPRHEWVKRTSSVRNEPLDLRNYATAALRILNPDLKYLKENKLDGNIFSQLFKRKRRRRRTVSKGL